MCQGCLVGGACQVIKGDPSNDEPPRLAIDVRQDGLGGNDVLRLALPRYGVRPSNDVDQAKLPLFKE